ncbi:4-diphosphocytidyl-2-C-methyl-D-erythritol kinase [Neorhodopirellula lusitana]|uniref:4-diphosphocytidyl-2-C-methyl-D-erythritol kinase n=1 Tax=Neorhodopirellula lusitana TaxID=445327 RepID=A0ABY1PSD9_9BACT|nr:4-(cytidine 5'-diphospho)-2-C-methyl-D-erythritol kinase [Neorhodopirellula lusitana]SMP38543.1 4-diphosphocytidyl-2-C-methyl-D-erythritol kinase [Neorhodopirellula lusitana]
MPTYRTSPPAKLNLFLEILGRRPDGFHELDTVMVAIDWRDELELTTSVQPGIRLQVDWLPSREAIAEQLQVAVDDPILFVPDDASNLVHQALSKISAATGYQGGWDVKLGKRIPSGAGMGGASSDAAATLRLAAAAISQVDDDMAERCSPAMIRGIAEQLGSDVPFFLDPESATGIPGAPVSGQPMIARALGRGEKLTFRPLLVSHRFLVVYPGVALSTPRVYQQCQVSEVPRSGVSVMDAFCSDDATGTQNILYNALESPARGLSPRIGEALECLPVTLSIQNSMTGSGSACFAWITDSGEPVEPLTQQVKGRLEGGALIRPVSTCTGAPEIQIA